MKSIIFCLGFSVALAEQKCQSSSLLQASTQHVFGTPVSLHFPTLSNFSENSFAELFPTAKLINLDKLAAAGVSAASPIVSDVPWGQKMINPAHYVASDGKMRVLGRVTQSTRCCSGDPIPAKWCSNNPPRTTAATDALVSCPVDKADNECKVLGQFSDPHTFRVNGDPFALVIEGAGQYCKPKILNLTSFQVVSLTLPVMSDCEKNWVPFVYEDELFVSYWLKPMHRVLRCSISSGSCQSAFNSSANFSDEGLPADRIMEEQEGNPYDGPTSLKSIHGGSGYAQLSKNYLVAAAHRFDLKFQFGGIRRYFHAFYAIRRKPPFEVVANTRWFQMPVFDTEEVAEWGLIQYAGGLMRQGDDFILSYGVGDCVARAVKIPVAHVAAALGL